jgi:hypothetical protein
MVFNKLAQLEKARKKLHDKHKFVVNFYQKNAEEPFLTYARFHNNYGYYGTQLGTNFNYAEIADEDTTRLVFWKEEVASVKNGDVVVAPWGAAYVVENTESDDRWTYKALVTKLHPSDAEIYEAPNGN